VTAMYQTPSLETSRGFVGANARWVHPKYPGSVGLGWLRLRSANIELTSTDEKVLGSDSLTNDLMLLGAGVRPFEHWSFGLALKYFRFAFNGFKESGFGVDLGAHGQYNPWRVGLVLTDIGGTTLTGTSVDPAGGDVEDRVPARLRPGLGWSFREPFDWPIHVTADIDAILKLQDAQDAKLCGGVEVWVFRDRAAIRSGYQTNLGPTLGFGARLGNFQIDYAFLFSNHLQDEHRLGTTFRF
jgi:hypothetical protein